MSCQRGIEKVNSIYSNQFFTAFPFALELRAPLEAVHSSHERAAVGVNAQQALLWVDRARFEFLPQRRDPSFAVAGVRCGHLDNSRPSRRPASVVIGPARSIAIKDLP